MFLAKVTGTVVATQKNPNFIGDKLLVVQPLDLNKNPVGASLLAIDSIDAGVGDIVIVIREGGSARIVLKNEEVPVQTVIVGVVDSIEVDERFIKSGD